MNILEFISGLEALPESTPWLARNKIDLASRFGLTTPPSPLPYDVMRTRIPDRAMDGYMAAQILSDPAIAEENFAHFAYTASAIFAAQQIALRSGATTRSLQTEYPYLVFPAIFPCLERIARALEYVPLVMNWWYGEHNMKADMQHVMPIFQLFETRLNPWLRSANKNGSPIEQCFQFLLCHENPSEFKEVRIGANPNQLPPTHGKIGLLVLDRVGSARNCALLFDRLKPRFSNLVTVLLYDKRTVIDESYPLLTARNSWRGVALKHLSYQSAVNPDDYALLAMQANYVEQ